MKNILAVIDYQNDFVNGTLGFPGAELLDEGISQKIKQFGKGNVLYTLDTHYKNYSETREGKLLPIEHCIENTFGWEPFGKTKDALNEVNAEKITKETFPIHPSKMTNIETLKEEPTTITIVGLVTNMCVLSNAIMFKSLYPNTEIIVDASLCDSFNKELHEKTLDVLEGLQITVINR